MTTKSQNPASWLSWIPFVAAGIFILAVYLAAVFGVIEVPYLMLRSAVCLVGGLAVLKQLRSANPKRRLELEGALRRGNRIGLAAGLAFAVLAVIGGLLSK